MLHDDSPPHCLFRCFRDFSQSCTQTELRAIEKLVEVGKQFTQDNARDFIEARSSLPICYVYGCDGTPLRNKVRRLLHSRVVAVVVIVLRFSLSSPAIGLHRCGLSVRGVVRLAASFFTHQVLAYHLTPPTLTATPAISQFAVLSGLLPLC